MIKFVDELYIHSGKVEKKEGSTLSVESECLVYEVLRVDKGMPVFLKEHMNRMTDSLKSVQGYEEDCESELKKEISKDVFTLIKESGKKKGNIQILIKVEDGAIENYCYFIKHSYPTEEMYRNGVDVITIREERSNPNAKILNQKFKEKVRKVLGEKGAYEALLIDHNGEVTEGSRSNVFFVKGAEVITAKSDKVLEGITRKKIIEIVKKEGIKYSERKIEIDEIFHMDGAFISGTSPEVLPIRKIEDEKFESSKNPIIKELLDKYREECKKDLVKLSKKKD